MSTCNDDRLFNRKNRSTLTVSQKNALFLCESNNTSASNIKHVFWSTRITKNKQKHEREKSLATTASLWKRKLLYWRQPNATLLTNKWPKNQPNRLQSELSERRRAAYLTEWWCGIIGLQWRHCALCSPATRWLTAVNHAVWAEPCYPAVAIANCFLLVQNNNPQDVFHPGHPVLTSPVYLSFWLSFFLFTFHHFFSLPISFYFKP